MLWFAEKYGGGDSVDTGGSCAPCELLDRLVEEFEGLAHLPETVAEKTFSPACPEAITIAPQPAEAHEVDTYLGQLISVRSPCASGAFL